jgi:hypothetical protein
MPQSENANAEGERSEAADQATREPGFPGRPVAPPGGRRRQPTGGPNQYGQLFLLSLTSVERTVLLYSVPHRNLL